MGHLYVPEGLSIDERGLVEMVHLGGVAATMTVNAPTFVPPVEDAPDSPIVPHVVRPLDGVRANIAKPAEGRVGVIWTAPDPRWGQAELSVMGGYSAAEMYELAKTATR